MSYARSHRAIRQLVLTAFVLCAVAPLSAQQSYKLPPKIVADILDAPVLPTLSSNSQRTWYVLAERASMPTIAELSQPMFRLAGFRINPATYGPHGGARVSAYTVKSVSTAQQLRVAVPGARSLSQPLWSPDGQKIAFTATMDNGIELWLADVAKNETHKLDTPHLNATNGNPCSWLFDSVRLLCKFVPDNQGAPPAEPKVPVGPDIQENIGRAAPAPTYEDLLSSAYDEALFDYYFTAQLAYVDVTSGARTAIGKPAIFDNVEPSPDGRFVLVARITRPYSYQVPAENFPHVTEVWDAQGNVVKEIVASPMEELPNGWVTKLPRNVDWRPTAPATLYYVEALDGGNPRAKVEQRDQVLLLAAPFTTPVEIARTQERFSGIRWGQNSSALISDFARAKRWARTWVFNPDQPTIAWRKVWDRSAEDAYGDPGTPMMRGSARGDALLQVGDNIFLTGPGSSPTGDRPFLDRLNLKTLKTERLWQSDADAYEQVVGLLDDNAQRLITRRESPADPANYFIRTRSNGKLVALTNMKDVAPEYARVQKQLVVYERADGVPLNGTLYLPPDYKPGTRLPVVMWAYPREFTSRAAAGQVRTAANRHTDFSGPSHLFFLTQGYAVFDGPTMPILGGDTANNTYVEQLVASAKAAVDKLVQLGIADPNRIGVGGHSYGAFMTANLLAHSDLFRAGIARSGAYNRTLTPFGFQNEERTYWEAPEIYQRMSPFNYADKIKEPLLMIHGIADNNTGTFPIQSQRMYAALKGHGGTVRLVMLPHEAHGYAARESVLHTVAEMLEWFDKYVKNAPARAPNATN